MSGRSEVLVVDNDAGVLGVLDAALRHHGLGVRVASGVWEAAWVYAEHCSTVGGVHLDVGLGDGDGPAALALLREIDPSVRCCFITAGSSGFAEADLLALGVRHVFRKPVPSYAELARALQALLAE
jgi:DNA-binding response OmpR family regulator